MVNDRLPARTAHVVGGEDGPGHARQFVRNVLTEWRLEPVASAELVVSEAVTHIVTQTGEPEVRVTVTRLPGSAARIEVEHHEHSRIDIAEEHTRMAFQMI